MMTVLSQFEERRNNDRRANLDRRKDRLAELFNWAVDEGVFIDLRRYARRSGNERRDGVLAVS